MCVCVCVSITFCNYVFIFFLNPLSRVVFSFSSSKARNVSFHLANIFR